MFAGATACAASCCATCACQACQCTSLAIAKTSARIAYCTLFFLSMLLAWLLRDFAKPMLEKIPWIVRGYIDANVSGSTWFGLQAVYRVSFGNFAFFFLLCIMMIGVTDRRDNRDKWVHHGSWQLKFLVWIIFMILPFLLPNEVLEGYAWTARFGSGIFLVLQMVILLDFADAWNQSWISKESENWLYALLAVTVTCYSLSIVLIGLMFSWFKPEGAGSCGLNVFFIVSTLILSVLFSGISVHPEVQRGSLMPSSVVTLYVSYLCYAALASLPEDDKCNGLSQDETALSDTSLALGMTITMVSVVYSALRAGSNSKFLSTSDEDEEYTAVPEANAAGPFETEEQQDMERNGGGGEDSGPKPVSYNYSMFHLIFALASMYIAMLMTGWGSDEQEKDRIDIGWTSVWVKMCSLWVTAAMYTWTLIAPCLFPDRDFS